MKRTALALIALILLPPASKGGDYLVTVRDESGREVSLTLNDGTHTFTLSGAGIFLGFPGNDIAPIPTPEPTTPTPQVSVRRAYEKAISSALLTVAKEIEEGRLTTQEQALTRFGQEVDSAKQAFSRAHSQAGIPFVDQAGRILDPKGYASSWRAFAR